MNALKLNKNRNFEKEDKGTTLVVMNKNDKTQEGPVQTNDLNNYIGSILITEIFST